MKVVFFSFPLLSILYIMGNKYAITERFRFEYSSEMNCLRKVSERLHNSDKGDSNIDGEKYRGCKNFHCTFSAFLHNIMYAAIWARRQEVEHSSRG